ncbi:MAG: D-aminoacyl-tRNA deacylase, partial [Chitinophagales bacterium]
MKNLLDFGKLKFKCQLQTQGLFFKLKHNYQHKHLNTKPTQVMSQNLILTIFTCLLFFVNCKNKKETTATKTNPAVEEASVEIDGSIFSAIKTGLLLFLGIESDDKEEDIAWL